MSAQQLDFHYRSSDPATSRAAGEAVDLNARCRECLDAIYRMRFSNPTFTDGELADFTNGERSVLARRRKDLVDRGLVEPVWLDGEYETRLGRRGRYEAVWRLSELGWLRAQVVS